MSAGLYTLTIDQGATLSLVLTWKDSSGNLVNLTGYTARMTLRPTYSSSTSVLSLTTENSRISLGGVAGTITLTVAAADTSALAAPQTGVYDLELVSGAGFVTRLVQGTFNVTPEATR